MGTLDDWSNTREKLTVLMLEVDQTLLQWVRQLKLCVSHDASMLVSQHLRDNHGLFWHGDDALKRATEYAAALSEIETQLVEKQAELRKLQLALYDDLAKSRSETAEALADVPERCTQLEKELSELRLAIAE